jgi:lysophospholipase L1-like esterase
MKALIVFFFIFINNVSHADYHIIGDSIFVHKNQEVKRQIEKSKNISITNHAVTGHWFKNIVEQFDKTSTKSGDIIIMDGGGNDIFGNSGNCRNNPNVNCKSQIDGIAEKFKNLLEKMLNRKIDTVYFLSPYYTSGWNGSGYEKAVDYGVDNITKICNESLMYCVFIDVRFAMKGNVVEWDGIHPNQNGCNILANSIIEAMKSAK